MKRFLIAVSGILWSIKRIWDSSQHSQASPPPTSSPQEFEFRVRGSVFRTYFITSVIPGVSTYQDVMEQINDQIRVYGYRVEAIYVGGEKRTAESIITWNQARLKHPHYCSFQEKKLLGGVKLPLR